MTCDMARLKDLTTMSLLDDRAKKEAVYKECCNTVAQRADALVENCQEINSRF